MRYIFKNKKVHTYLNAAPNSLDYLFITKSDQITFINLTTSCLVTNKRRQVYYTNCIRLCWFQMQTSKNHVFYFMAYFQVVLFWTLNSNFRKAYKFVDLFFVIVIELILAKNQPTISNSFWKVPNMISYLCISFIYVSF